MFSVLIEMYFKSTQIVCSKTKGVVNYMYFILFPPLIPIIMINYVCNIIMLFEKWGGRDENCV
jgi:hypothetical protein